MRRGEWHRMRYRAFLLAVVTLSLGACGGGGGGGTTTPTGQICVNPPANVTYAAKSPANGATGVSINLGVLDITVQTVPGTGASLPPAFPGATLIASPGTNVSIGAFTLVSSVPGSGPGGSFITGDYQAAMPTLAAGTVYVDQLTVKTGCTINVGTFST